MKFHEQTVSVLTLFISIFLFFCQSSKDFEFANRYDTFFQDINSSTTPNPLDLITLDTAQDIVPYFWKLPKNRSRFMEYYEGTKEFKHNSSDKGKCAHYMSKEALENLTDASGIWVSCQDPKMDPVCLEIPPCYAHIGYDDRRVSNPRLRTIRVTFTLDEFAILRIRIGASLSGKCYDFGKRKDPFSPCQFRHIKELEEMDGWYRALINTYPEQNTKINQFTLEMLTWYKNDIILIDKVETTEEQLCEWTTTCPTPTTTPFPTFSTPPVTQTTTIPTTTIPIITDPEEPTTTTPPPNASSFLSHGTSLIVLAFLSNLVLCF